MTNKLVYIYGFINFEISNKLEFLGYLSCVSTIEILEYIYIIITHKLWLNIAYCIIINALYVTTSLY